ncbi:hypothetical protein ACFOON_00640 [Novosphingobium piscinae]|uniref:Uncharacterized protein n=1 Tax=Novosphingobium piscinae TaxID=1507448 RepID=A0A7X1FVT6_9SPHN|nr:hypothetical protein [Novosphingobium piscinae]MBC2667910.1 hypothetical protein [Novosphingobium piscinae]
MATSTEDIGTILSSLAAQSRRPRYAFMVLNLISEVADARGQAGPFVERGEAPVPIRDWLCEQLMPLSSRDDRRRRLRDSVAAGLAERKRGDGPVDEALVEAAVHERALAVGKTNVSRAVTDLVRAGLVRRHYAGWCRDHRNRGGGRHAVYTVAAEALSALRRRDRLL